MASLHAQQFEILVACTCNCFSSVGMLLFNKLAVQALPLECSLVWLQLFFAAFFMLIFGFPYLHIGSMKDFLRWCMVVPFFTGMLMTSILALKKAPMSLVIVLRSASPLFFPNLRALLPRATAYQWAHGLCHRCDGRRGGHVCLPAPR